MKYEKGTYELSRPLQVANISKGGVEEHIVASEIERKELAKRFNLQDLSNFKALLNIDRAKGKMISVKGKLSADVITTCVVTLEPVPMTVHEEIDMLFAPPHLIGRPEEMAELGDVDQPEPIVKGIIDLGELVAQYLSAALPLYPRKEGVQYEGNSDLTPVSQENNPFLQLKETLKNPNKPNI